MILNPALFFAVHVLWPQSLNGRFDAASIARFRLEVGVIPLLLGCSVLGLALSTALAHRRGRSEAAAPDDPNPYR